MVSFKLTIHSRVVLQITSPMDRVGQIWAITVNTVEGKGGLGNRRAAERGGQESGRASRHKLDNKQA